MPYIKKNGICLGKGEAGAQKVEHHCLELASCQMNRTQQGLHASGEPTADNTFKGLENPPVCRLFVACIEWMCVLY